LGKLGRREGKGRTVGERKTNWLLATSLPLGMPKSQRWSGEKTFIYEGLKVEGLWVDFRCHTTPFLVAQLLFSFAVLLASYWPHVFLYQESNYESWICGGRDDRTKIRLNVVDDIFWKKSKKLFFFEKLFCARFEGAGGTGGGDGGW
jgi:hypothetical protein